MWRKPARKWWGYCGISGVAGDSNTHLLQLYRNRRITVIYRHGLFEPKLLYLEKNMNQAEEKALKALNDATEELRLMQDLTCETPEEEQVRASEIDKLVASVEAKQEDLAREQRSAAALAKVESVKSQVTKTGLVRSTPEKKTEIRAIDKKKLHRCFDGDYEGALALGRYVQSIAGVQARAASAYPQASVDSIAAYGSGENATTFPTSMSALVMDTLYNGLINEVAYTALCPQLARTFNVPANGLQIPIADEAPYAKFYSELAHIDPVQPVVNAAQLVLHKMAHLNYCSSELLEDTIYAAGYVIETFSNSFSKTIDNCWLQGMQVLALKAFVIKSCNYCCRRRQNRLKKHQWQSC